MSKLVYFDRPLPKPKLTKVYGLYPLQLIGKVWYYRCASECSKNEPISGIENCGLTEEQAYSNWLKSWQDWYGIKL